MDDRSFRHVLLFALSVYLAPCAALAQTVPEPAPTMIVDAATTVAESDSGNDLLTVKNIYQGANAPADGTITPLQETFRDIKMKRLRLLQSDAFCDLDAANMFGSVPFEKHANGNYGPVVAGECYPLRWHIDWATDNGLTLHVALASTLPVSFAQQGPAETWNPATKARYGIYAKELVNTLSNAPSMPERRRSSLKSATN